MIAVWFAILAGFVFFGFSFFVINLSNTHEHRRHLQVQVDDGALATGPYFTGCFQNPAAANANIAREARRFSGDPTYPTNYFSGGIYDTAKYPGPFNQQVEKADRVSVGLNKAAFPPYATPITEFDPSYDLRPDLTGVQNLPCDADILDVKATDTDIPTPFGGLVPAASGDVDVKARARIEIKKVKVLNGLMPWAVPEVRPKAVIAIFVDEGSGSVRGAQPLVDSGATSMLNGGPQEVWAADAQFIGHGQSGTGVIIGVSRVAAPSTSGTLAQICGQAGMKCYAGASQTSGLWFIDGFGNGGGTLAAPHLGSVTLQNGSCGDDSAPYFLLNAGCSVQVRANVDFGVSGDPRLAPNCASVSVAGTAMTWSSGTLWTATVSIATVSGRNAMKISWSSGPKNNGTCGGSPPNSGSFPETVAAPYAADDASGPVNYVVVTGAGGGYVGSLGTSSNSPNTVHVQVGLEPPLRVTTNGEPPIRLRFASKSGSLNQALDCDAPNRNLDDEVRDGCKTYYQANTRNDVCDPPWTGSSLPPATYTPPSGNLNDAPDCIAAKTGDVTAMAKGLHDRFENPCTPNNWPTNGGPVPDSTDPRWVILVITDFTAFSGSGAEVVPITKFAGFYVTGYFHQQSATGCTGDTYPPGVNPNANSSKGDVYGYYVTDVPNLPGALPSTDYCIFNDVGVCIAVLTQ